MVGITDLAGYKVVVTAGRASGELAQPLRRMGAQVFEAPVTAMAPPLDCGLLHEATLDLVASPPDYLVLSTGAGLESWLALATGWRLAAGLRRSLGRARVAARGSRAAAAAEKAGIDLWYRADGRLSTVVARLLEEPLEGRRVAFVHPGDGSSGAPAQLARAGAEVVHLSPYHLGPPDDPTATLQAIEMVSRAAVDVVTFVASPGVRHFMGLADSSRRGREVISAMNGPVMVACVGPLCAEAAQQEGIASPAWPETWTLPALIDLVAESLRGRSRRYHSDRSDLVLQGSAVMVEGESVGLDERERAVLAKLAERPGATVSRRVLLRHVWKDPHVDPGVLDTTVGQIRRKLGPSGEMLEGAFRRGYRLNAVALPQVGRSDRGAGRPST